jgi:tetratricopeptide (TPR) repeat protein
MEGRELWTAIAGGEASIRDLAGVDDATIARIRNLGITAFTCGRHEQAAKIFAGLEALDPRDPKHALFLGHALRALNQPFEAREAWTRFLDRAEAAGVARVEIVRALLARASIELGFGNAAQAASDLKLARERAEGDGESLALLATAGAAP